MYTSEVFNRVFDGLRLSPTAREMEWQMTLQIAQHFNDLLMRLRSFGLPLLVTVMGVGVGLSFQFRIQNVPGWVTLAILIGLEIVVVWITIHLWNRHGWGAPSRPALEHEFIPHGALEPLERALWALPSIIASVGLAYEAIRVTQNTHLLDKSVDYSAALPVLMFGLALLTVLYSLDRFYYYKLLLGAVNRAKSLESEMGFQLTGTITALIEPPQASSIITVIYFIPGLVAYVLGVVMLIFQPGIVDLGK